MGLLGRKIFQFAKFLQQVLNITLQRKYLLFIQIFGLLNKSNLILGNMTIAQVNLRLGTPSIIDKLFRLIALWMDELAPLFLRVHHHQFKSDPLLASLSKSFSLLAK